MNKFFESNPGLRSRFNTFIEFEDYSSSELLEILNGLCEKEDYCLSKEVLSYFESELDRVVSEKNEKFANGRFIRNVFEEMTMNHARRVSNNTNPSIMDLKEFIIDDLPSAIRTH